MSASSCAIHQPNLFPRLSTLAKLYAADTWVVLDSVQYNNQDYQHRTRLARLHDPADQQWLTLPVHRPRGQPSRLDEIQLADAAASRRRLARLVQEYYGRSRYWPCLREPLCSVVSLMRETSQLTTITEGSTRVLLDMIAWPGVIVRSSESPGRSERSARLADLTRGVGATTYLCGTGGSRYLSSQPFADLGVTVRVCTPPVPGDNVRNPWGAARQVSALWALMQAGPDAVRLELQRAKEIWSASEPHMA